MFLCIVFLYHVSCVPNTVTVSGLSFVIDPSVEVNNLELKFFNILVKYCFFLLICKNLRTIIKIWKILFCGAGCYIYVVVCMVSWLNLISKFHKCKNKLIRCRYPEPSSHIIPGITIYRAGIITRFLTSFRRSFRSLRSPLNSSYCVT
jgi:hypothetical protein